MRRNLNIVIVSLATLLAIYTQAVMHPSVILFMLAFNIIGLIYYRESAFIIAFHVTSMFLITGFFVFVMRLISDPGLFLLFRFFVDAGGFAIIIVAFIVILQNRSEKGIERSMMLVALVYYIFYTFTRFQIMAYLETLFSPIARDVNNALGAFFVTNLVFVAIIGILQIYMVIRFDIRRERREYLEKKKKLEIDQMFY
jgi:hypothetical protein